MKINGSQPNKQVIGHILEIQTSQPFISSAAPGYSSATNAQHPVCKPLCCIKPMKAKYRIYLNLCGLILFFILRAVIKNVNVIFTLVLLLEGLVILGTIIRLIVTRTSMKDLIMSSSHIFGILVIIFIAGHLITVTSLNIYHSKAIQTFAKYKDEIPVADRVNGAWILDVEDFEIEKDERTVLEANYNKLSPIFYDRGYCYVQLGGFLNNSGGYFLKIDNDAAEAGSFGFHRVKELKRIAGNWYYYE